MNIITAYTLAGHPNRTDVTDQAAYHLHMHGWAPPAERRVIFLDDDLQLRELIIPARTYPTPTPPAEQLETLILARIAARIDNGNPPHDAIVKGIGDAAEALHDTLTK